MVVMCTINSVDKAKSLCGFTPNLSNTTVSFETKSFFLLNTSTLIYNVSTHQSRYLFQFCDNQKPKKEVLKKPRVCNWFF